MQALRRPSGDPPVTVAVGHSARRPSIYSSAALLAEAGLATVAVWHVRCPRTHRHWTSTIYCCCFARLPGQLQIGPASYCCRLACLLARVGTGLASYCCRLACQCRLLLLFRTAPGSGGNWNGIRAGADATMAFFSLGAANYCFCLALRGKSRCP